MNALSAALARHHRATFVERLNPSRSGSNALGWRRAARGYYLRAARNPGCSFDIALEHDRDGGCQDAAHDREPGRRAVPLRARMPEAIPTSGGRAHPSLVQRRRSPPAARGSQRRNSPQHRSVAFGRSRTLLGSRVHELGVRAPSPDMLPVIGDSMTRDLRRQQEAFCSAVATTFGVLLR